MLEGEIQSVVILGGLWFGAAIYHATTLRIGAGLGKNSRGTLPTFHLLAAWALTISCTASDIACSCDTCMFTIRPRFQDCGVPTRRPQSSQG